MKEEYMHFLWRMRFLPTRNFTLHDGTEMEILEFGEYNENESGPDFFHAKILIDGILWFGHVEFHLKASDWYKHNHQSDTAYDHVILHVVWEMDQEVICQNKSLPTLLLSKYAVDDHSVSFTKGKNHEQLLPCSFALDEIEEIYIEKEKESALQHRLNRKTSHFLQNPNNGFAQVLYELIATAFGAKINKDPFWQLTREVPIVRLLQMREKSRGDLIMLSSGVYDKTTIQLKKNVRSLESFQWKRKGLHPKGAPEIRVKQFALFVQHFDFDFGFLDLSAEDLLAYIRQSFLKAEGVEYAKSFQNLIIINSFVPFLWWLGEKRGESQWQNRAVELLQLLPNETNHLTKFLKKAGFSIRTAYDSQALLELYSIRCSGKKCLTCGVGIKILGR